MGLAFAVVTLAVALGTFALEVVEDHGHSGEARDRRTYLLALICCCTASMVLLVVR